MHRRSRIGLQLILSSALFLGLTIVTAVGVRNYNEQAARRSPASIDANTVFEHRGQLSSSQLGVLGSTLLTRGRRVMFREDVFRQAVARGTPVSVNLFPDLTVQIQFQNASVYQVNEPLFVGQVAGDTESQVRFMIVGHVLDGRIQTHGREYRIIDGANGVHYVTEAEKR